MGGEVLAQPTERCEIVLILRVAGAGALREAPEIVT